MTFPIINISDWPHEDKNVSGSKEKRWYRNPSSNQLALFKLPISLTDENWRINNQSTGEAWAEKICSEIGNLIGYTTHRVDIGVLSVDKESEDYYGIKEERLQKNNQISGALCWSFLDEQSESLVEGADMIMEYDETYDRYALSGKKERYNFDLLYRLFYENNILDKLFQMIIFDTLIGNTDRHQDNFGMIRNEWTGTLYFAPFYDNSSSLGRELPEERVKKMLQDSRMFHAYIFNKKSATLIRIGKSWSKKGPGIIEFYEHVRRMYPEEIKKHSFPISKLTDGVIENIVSEIPFAIMSANQKELVIKILKTRRDYLLN